MYLVEIFVVTGTWSAVDQYYIYALYSAELFAIDDFRLPNQTFSLRMVTRNPDGTTSITTSMPCSAGSSTDICLVKVIRLHAHIIDCMMASVANTYVLSRRIARFIAQRQGRDLW